MDKIIDYFKVKKITVMGLGLLGRGVGDVAFLAECGAEVTVTDLKTVEQLAQSIEKLKDFSNIRFVFGEHKKEDFEKVDMILVAAGVPFDSPYLEHARSSGVRLAQSAALFMELSKIPTIGITGTRGKSTTTAMVHHVLEFITGEKVLKGGNVRGVSNLQLFKEIGEDSLAVMELDSWQLQGFGWAGISPQIAVFTNFMEDHLNYYHNDMDRYFADKANIFINQDEHGVFITTPEVFERAKEYARGKEITLGQEVKLVDGSILPEDMLLSMPGEHNRMNAALAYEALLATGLTAEEIFEGLASFPGVEGRLELLSEVAGVKIYNDNNATTPTATARGIEAVANGKNVVLLCGGTDKGVEFGTLIHDMEQYCAHVVLYSGTGTEKLKAQIVLAGSDPARGEISYEEHDTLKACVEAVMATSVPGNVILYSPGFASFGTEFKNEYDRNDQFVNLVRTYESE